MTNSQKLEEVFNIIVKLTGVFSLVLVSRRGFSKKILRDSIDSLKNAIEILESVQ